MMEIEKGTTGVWCENDNIWFLFKNYKAFGTISLNEDKKCEVTYFPLAMSEGNSPLFGAIVKYKEYLIFSPIYAQGIMVYSLKTQCYKMISLKKQADFCEESGLRFYTSFLYKDTLFMFSDIYPAIVCLNLTTWQVIYINEPINQIMKNGIKDNYFMTCYGNYENYVYLAAAKSNDILQLDVNTYEYELIKIGKKEDRFTVPAVDKEDVWLMQRDNSNNMLVKYCISSRNTYYYDLNRLLNLNDICKSYISSVIYKNRIYFFPSMCEGFIICVDKEKEIIDTGFSEEICKGKFSSGFSYAGIFGPKLYAYNCESGCFIQYDAEINKYSEIDIKLKDSDQGQLGMIKLCEILKRDNLVVESDYIGFSSFIAAIGQTTPCDALPMSSVPCIIGKKIHEENKFLLES